MIKQVAKKYDLKPEVLSNELIGEMGLHDIKQGELTIEGLSLHVKLWIKSGKPNLLK